MKNKYFTKKDYIAGVLFLLFFGIPYAIYKVYELPSFYQNISRIWFAIGYIFLVYYILYGNPNFTTPIKDRKSIKILFLLVNIVFAIGMLFIYFTR